MTFLINETGYFWPSGRYFVRFKFLGKKSSLHHLPDFSSDASKPFNKVVPLYWWLFDETVKGKMIYFSSADGHQTVVYLKLLFLTQKWSNGTLFQLFRTKKNIIACKDTVNGGRHIVNSDSRLIKMWKLVQFCYFFFFILCQIIVIYSPYVFTFFVTGI